MKFYLDQIKTIIQVSAIIFVNTLASNQSKLWAQVISNNGAHLTTVSGTVFSLDSLHTNASSTISNEGIINLVCLINAGTAQGNGTYNISNLFTNTGTFTAGNSTVHFNGSGNQNIPSLTYHHLSASGSSSLKTALGNLTVNGTLNINNGATIDLTDYLLTGSLIANAGTGLLKTQNTSSTPIPTGKTWTADVLYNSSSLQFIAFGNYNNLNASGGHRELYAGTTGIAGSFTPGNGNYTITGSTIDFNGSSVQTIPAFDFNSMTVSGGSIKNIAGAVSIIDALSLGANTTLALGANDITLKSTATSVARITNTPSSADITYGTGRFVIERYVPGRRKYRLFTSSVTSSPNATLVSGEESLSIWGNWQNAGNNAIANTGTIITGGSSADGFDQQTPNSSLYTYNETARLYSRFSTSNGKNTKYTPLKAGVAYYMFVYGDRTNTITTSSPKFTTIKSRGKILMGDQVYSTSSTIPLSGDTGRFTMLGNPFASPVNWATISKSDLENTYWGWDPNLASTGGYITVSTNGTVTLQAPYSGSTGLNQYIQPGQGFFVKTTGLSPTLTIREQDKVSNFNANAFRTARRMFNDISLVAVNLQYPSGVNKVLADGVLVAFDAAFSNQAGTEDATKMVNSAESISIMNNNTLLSIDARQMPQIDDTLFLNVTKLTKPQYTLQIFAHQMEGSSVQAVLQDAYLNSSEVLSLLDTNIILFNVNPAVPASADINRFRIVFHQTFIPLPVTYTVLKATPKDNQTIQIDWEVGSEKDILKYDVEKSLDAVSFGKIGEIKSKGNNSSEKYSWTDGNSNTGNIFYRIVAQQVDGKIILSKIVTVKMGSDAGFKVFPNPVVNQQLNIRAGVMQKGRYNLSLQSSTGQQILAKEINHSGGFFNQVIYLGKLLPQGIYYLKISDGNQKYVQPVFVE